MIRAGATPMLAKAVGAIATACRSCSRFGFTENRRGTLTPSTFMYERPETGGKVRRGRWAAGGSTGATSVVRRSAMVFPWIQPSESLLASRTRYHGPTGFEAIKVNRSPWLTVLTTLPDLPGLSRRFACSALTMAATATFCCDGNNAGWSALVRQ